MRSLLMGDADGEETTRKTGDKGRDGKENEEERNEGKERKVKGREGKGREGKGREMEWNRRVGKGK